MFLSIMQVVFSFQLFIVLKAFIEEKWHTSALVYVLSVMKQKSSIRGALISSYFLQSQKA